MYMSVKKGLYKMLEVLGIKKKQQPQVQQPLNSNFKGVYRATEKGLVEVYCQDVIVGNVHTRRLQQLYHRKLKQDTLLI